MLETVHIAQGIDGSMHNTIYEAKHINIAVTERGRASLVLTGATPDSDGRRLVWAVHTAVRYATKHVKETQ